MDLHDRGNAALVTHWNSQIWYIFALSDGCHVYLYISRTIFCTQISNCVNYPASQAQGWWGSSCRRRRRDVRARGGLPDRPLRGFLDMIMKTSQMMQSTSIVSAVSRILSVSRNTLMVSLFCLCLTDKRVKVETAEKPLSKSDGGNTP
jgi:hypothetical protein